MDVLAAQMARIGGGRMYYTSPKILQDKLQKLGWTEAPTKEDPIKHLLREVYARTRRSN